MAVTLYDVRKKMYYEFDPASGAIQPIQIDIGKSLANPPKDNKDWMDDEEERRRAEQIKSEINNGIKPMEDSGESSLRDAIDELDDDELDNLMKIDKTDAGNAFEKRRAQLDATSRNSHKRSTEEVPKTFKEAMEELAASYEPDEEDLVTSTYSRSNRRNNAFNSDTPIYKGKTTTKVLPDENPDGIPKVNVYYDCSSSFSNGEDLIADKQMSMLMDLQADGVLEINRYYFNTCLGATRREASPGYPNECQGELLWHMAATKPDNVIIMTDSDLDFDFDSSETAIMWDGVERKQGMQYAPVYKCPGNVYYIWGYRKASKFMQHIIARGKTYEFKLSEQ